MAIRGVVHAILSEAEARVFTYRRQLTNIARLGVVACAFRGSCELLLGFPCFLLSGGDSVFFVDVVVVVFWGRCYM